MNVLERLFYKTIADKTVEKSMEVLPEIKTRNNYRYVLDKNGKEYVKRTVKPLSSKQLLAQHNFANIVCKTRGTNQDNIHKTMQEELKNKNSKEAYEGLNNTEIYVPLTEKEKVKAERERLLKEVLEALKNNFFLIEK